MEQIMLDIQSLFAFHNPWWLGGKVPEELNLPFHRPVFDNIFRYLELDRIIILKGPRRTGKSTLMFQIINKLLQNGIEANRIFYLPFDDPDLSAPFIDIFLEYEKFLGREVSQLPVVYCLFDEIQHLENWSAHLKKYYDKKWPIKFLVSGSSASLMKHDAESLAGRTIEEIILPFSFAEFLDYHLEQKDAALLNELKNSFNLLSPKIPLRLNLIEKKIAILFEKYLTIGGFPGLFNIEEPTLRKKLLQEDIIEKVIYRDLVIRYGIKKPEILEKLFLYCINQSSDILNVSSLANSLKLSREATQDYIRYLVEAFLVMISPKFALSVETTIRANPKLYVLDAGFLQVFSNIAIGRRIESITARHLYSYHPSYYRNRGEVDFVLRLENQVLPIEVKYRNNIRKQDLTGLKLLARKTAFKKAIMLTKNLQDSQGNIDFIPVHLFLAMI